MPAKLTGPTGIAVDVPSGYTLRGEWSSGATYGIRDLVRRYGVYYMAIAGSINVDPAVAASFTTLGSQSDITYNFSAGGASQGMAQAFTPTANMTVNAVKWYRNAATGGLHKLGIASSLGANTAATVWMSNSDTAVLSLVGYNTVSIPSVALSGGTQYFLATVAPSDGEAFDIRRGYPEVLSGLTTGTLYATNATPLQWVDQSTVAHAAFALGTSLPSWAPYLAAPVPLTGTTGARPAASSLNPGTGYYDTTLGRPMWSDGSVYKDAGLATYAGNYKLGTDF